MERCHFSVCNAKPINALRYTCCTTRSCPAKCSSNSPTSVPHRLLLNLAQLNRHVEMCEHLHYDSSIASAAVATASCEFTFAHVGSTACVRHSDVCAQQHHLDVHHTRIPLLRHTPECHHHHHAPPPPGQPKFQSVRVAARSTPPSCHTIIYHTLCVLDCCPHTHADERA